MSSLLSPGDGKVKVHNNGMYPNKTAVEICGFATIPDPQNPGLLLVDFPTSKEPKLGP